MKARGHPAYIIFTILWKKNYRCSQVAFLFAVGGFEDCHNPCNVKWGLDLSYFNMAPAPGSAGLWFLRPWAFQSYEGAEGECLTLVSYLTLVSNKVVWHCRTTLFDTSVKYDTSVRHSPSAPSYLYFDLIFFMSWSADSFLWNTEWHSASMSDTPLPQFP